MELKMQQEAVELIEDLNCDMVEQEEWVDYVFYEFRSSGWRNSAIYFAGLPIWTEENDEREFIEEKNEHEPLRDFVIRESLKVTEKLQKQMKRLKK